MTDGEIYVKAIKEFFEKYGKFEHDEEKAIELFDILLDKGIKSDCDTIEDLCLKASHDKFASKEIAKIYDIISLYKSYQKSSIRYWKIDKLLDN